MIFRAEIERLDQLNQLDLMGKKPVVPIPKFGSTLTPSATVGRVPIAIDGSAKAELVQAMPPKRRPFLFERHFFSFFLLHFLFNFGLKP